jgi:hypothetical protein
VSAIVTAFYLYIAPVGAHEGMVHLSTDGVIEDCATKSGMLPRELGGVSGDPKAEDLLAQRLAHRTFRRCRKCFRYGPLYERRT